MLGSSRLSTELSWMVSSPGYVLIQCAGFMQIGHCWCIPVTIGPWLQIHFASWCSDFIIARVPKSKASPLCIPNRSKKSGWVTRVYGVVCSLKTVGLEVGGKENQCNEVRRLDSRISVQVDLGEWWCVVKTLHRVMVYHGYVGRIALCTIFAAGWGRYTLSVDKSGYNLHAIEELLFTGSNSKLQWASVSLSDWWKAKLFYTFRI